MTPSPEGARYTLNHDTLGMTPNCSAASEVDLNLAPNDHYTYPAYPEGVIPFDTPHPMLGDGDWHVSWRQSIFESQHQDRHCPSPWNLHGTLVGVLLHNFVSDPDGSKIHTVFYQIMSRDSRARIEVDGWFLTMPPWGVNDSVEAYLQTSQLPDGTEKSYDIAFTERLSALIKYSAYLPLDSAARDPKNWTVMSAYFSAWINGEAKGTVTFSQPRLYLKH